MQVRGRDAPGKVEVSVAGAAPEPLQMEQQQIDFQGRLDATQLEGCWINLCGCCQGYRPSGPDTLVTSCNLMFGVIVCPDCGEVYTRVPGTNNFRKEGESVYHSDVSGTTVRQGHGAFGADVIAKFNSRSIMFEQNGCEWMCCGGLHCKVPCSVPAAITKN